MLIFFALIHINIEYSIRVFCWQFQVQHRGTETYIQSTSSELRSYRPSALVEAYVKTSSKKYLSVMVGIRKENKEERGPLNFDN